MTVTDTPTIKPASIATVVAVDATLLKAAMAKLKPALLKRSGNSVLYCVRIDADGSDVELTATNLDTTITTVVTGIVSAPGSFLVPADVINKVLSVRSKGTIEITGSNLGGKVSNGNARLEFEPNDVAEYPKIPVATGRRITLNLDIIADLLPAVSADESRPILCSLYVQEGTYAATDSYRLFVTTTTTKTGAVFLLPRQAAEVMAKYKGTAACTVGERNITVVLDGTTTLTSRLVEGEFPLFRNLIPANPQHEIAFTDAMVGDLKTVIKLAGGGDPSTPVRISQVGDALELRIGLNVDHGRPAVVLTPGSSTLGDASVGFNPHYILDVLTGTTSNVLRCVDTLKPVTVREPAPQFGEGAERVRLVMPVRAN